jgi:hypothetical protein
VDAVIADRLAGETLFFCLVKLFELTQSLYTYVLKHVAFSRTCPKRPEFYLIRPVISQNETSGCCSVAGLLSEEIEDGFDMNAELSMSYLYEDATLI